MIYYRFLLKPFVSLPKWLKSPTSEAFSITEEDGKTWVYLPLPNAIAAEELLKKVKCFLSFEAYELKNEIDWEEQWATHSPYFKDGLFQIDLSTFLPNHPSPILLKLLPGPGFGDLSHPTTRITLSMMAPYVSGKNIIDIGCGSGILTLAALKLSAQSAIGIDIDKEALSHAEKNALLNGLEENCTFFTPEKFNSNPENHTVILMNMIRSQQNEAWASLPQLHGYPMICFTSGILVSERDDYIQECTQKGWELVAECQEEEWLGFQWKV